MLYKLRFETLIITSQHCIHTAIDIIELTLFELCFIANSVYSTNYLITLVPNYSRFQWEKMVYSLCVIALHRLEIMFFQY